MNWKPAKILFNPELEALQMISDVRGYRVTNVYISKQIKKKLMINAIKSSIIVNELLERMYVSNN